MVRAHLEILVEPFKPNEPGEHVRVVLDELRSAGLDPELGPFATAADGDVEQVCDAIRAATRSAIERGATAVQFRVETIDD